eukprot:TRINITY_DN1847_c0_g1_i1.p1 TRINITY_DN1847_c0_g1~~TRINITY_DN1847_c0_g1_i1.p1  ORF type:complete len:994 (-),score=192.62 TRINITY_DN1847_c0_g1_i1:508-3489(-)
MASIEALAAAAAASAAAMSGHYLEFPSSKLGQLLGYRGLTIQKVKERSGVTRLHIPPHEKERAKLQHTIPIEVQGTPEQVDLCRLLLDGIAAGNQSDLGHTTTYVSVEPSVIGKLMGYKGKTVKEMTDATGAYIEIQQDRSKGMQDTPQLFIAGPPEAVEKAAQLIVRFIASPGANLQAVLAEDPCFGGQINGGAFSNPQVLQHSVAQNLLAPYQAAPETQGALVGVAPSGAFSAVDPEGPKEERIVEVPARRKGHLLGLRGQTIDLVRKMSGVIKCHIQADRERGQASKVGMIPVQVFGAPDRVAVCISIIEGIVAGDHSGIGHVSDFMIVEPAKVERIKGERWQVINTLKDLTNTYMDILQGAEDGVPVGETQLFMAGPPENVERARTIVNAMLTLMDQMPANADASLANPDMLGSLINRLVPTMAAPQAAPRVQQHHAPAPVRPSFPQSGNLGGINTYGSIGGGLGGGFQARSQQVFGTQSPPAVQNLIASLSTAARTLPPTASAADLAATLQSALSGLAQMPAAAGGAVGDITTALNSVIGQFAGGNQIAVPQPQPQQHNFSNFGGNSGSSYTGTIRPVARSRSPRRAGACYGGDPGFGGGNVGTSGNVGMQTMDFPSSKLGQLLGFRGLTIQKVKERCGLTRLHIPPHEKERAKSQAFIPIEVHGSPEQIDHCRALLDAVCHGDQSELGHATSFVNVEPSVIGKLMGFKGKTVKEMTEATGAYIEIQQDRARGMDDTPQLFVAGPSDAVERATDLIRRFIASPGADLKAVLSESTDNNAAGAFAPVTSSVSQGGGLHLFDPEGPKEERVIEVPAKKKGHLLGLHGQTIELIRHTSGVIKCHIQVERDRGYVDKAGAIRVQVFGAPDKVANCLHLIERVMAGDHTGIGHSTELLVIEPEKVERLKGERWQVINALKDLTSCYMDVLQDGPDALGIEQGTQLFIAGPPENVVRAKTIVTALLSLMDQMPASGEANPELLGSLIGSLVPKA